MKIRRHLRKITFVFHILSHILAAAFSLYSCAPATLPKADAPDIRVAAERGDAKYQVLTGDMYEYGAGVPADMTEAAKWYQQAAFQGNPEAQYYLGILYGSGAGGFPQNTAGSLRWLFKAAEQGREKARIMLACLYLKDKQHQQEILRIIDGYRQEAEKGSAEAQYTLGWIYREGVGLPGNPQEALTWYRKSAGQNNAKAQFALGNMYLEGIGVPANPAEALVWHQKSAETEIKARAKLRELYEGGAGVQKNEEEVKKWSKVLAASVDDSVRPYLNIQHNILDAEQEKNPARALRACHRIIDADPADGKVSDVCKALSRRIGEKMAAEIQEAGQALEKRDLGRFRELLPRVLFPDFNELQLRTLVASAWRLIEDKNRIREKNATDLLETIEFAERSEAYRRQNEKQLFVLIGVFKTIVDDGLADNPGDEALLALARRGEKAIAGFHKKIAERPQKKIGEKSPKKMPEESGEEITEENLEDNEPGLQDYKEALALFDGGRFEDASRLFEKVTKIRGFKHIAAGYIYLGVTYLARINPANVRQARTFRLKGIAYFQNALRFNKSIALPAGYHKFQDVFEEAKKRLK
ncbi:MAG: sel1 repeat family protein [Deltaproteobacteria bacterium]|nr:sel1 repeat family protein [Deltaproteobacteria bacterium]